MGQAWTAIGALGTVAAVIVALWIALTERRDTARSEAERFDMDLLLRLAAAHERYVANVLPDPKPEIRTLLFTVGWRRVPTTWAAFLGEYGGAELPPNTQLTTEAVRQELEVAVRQAANRIRSG